VERAPSFVVDSSWGGTIFRAVDDDRSAEERAVRKGSVENAEALCTRAATSHVRRRRVKTRGGALVVVFFMAWKMPKEGRPPTTGELFVFVLSSSLSSSALARFVVRAHRSAKIGIVRSHERAVMQGRYSLGHSEDRGKQHVRE
jgi:hypothetical protein